MKAPILPVGSKVDKIIYWGSGSAGGQDPFIVMLQNALTARGYNTAGDPPGQYGPGTAMAIERFQLDHPVSTVNDRIFSLIGFNIAGCATYNALGLGVSEVYPIVIPGYIDNNIVVSISLLASQGVISLSCGPSIPAPPPVQKPGLLTSDYILFGIVAIIAGYIFVSARRK